MSNDKQERIYSAATEYKYNYLADAVVLRLNYDDKYTADHEYIMSQHDKDVVCIKKTDGFITNKNRFVDPKEAMGIAILANQIQLINDAWELFQAAQINQDHDAAPILKTQFSDIYSEHEERELKPEDLY